METVQADRGDKLARLALFADVPAEELGALAKKWDEVAIGEGQWVVRRGEPGTSLYILLDGEVGVVIDDVEMTTLGRGSFFGEVSLLLGEPAMADIVARTPLRCLVIPEAELEPFLLAHPRVMLNLLKTEARRVRTAAEWHN